MHELESRLVRCFRAVFPKLTDQEILVSSASASNWDSMNTVALLAVIEEEFALKIQPADVESLNSFQAILQYVKRANGA
jgi:acyl carrier protein